MVENHYRWDFIGLSTDVKPTPETSEKVTDGSTFYCSDTSKLYVFCDTQWYEKVAPNLTVVQTTGQSTTDVMSQKAVTDELGSMVEKSSFAFNDSTDTLTITVQE